jgi:hypothetical protein
VITTVTVYTCTQLRHFRLPLLTILLLRLAARPATAAEPMCASRLSNCIYAPTSARSAASVLHNLTGLACCCQLFLLMRIPCYHHTH